MREATELLLRELRHHHPPAIQLKWPNDILCDNKKIAGLLCERLDKIDLIGLGLNVNLDTTQAPRALRDRITSLADQTGQPIDLTDALIHVARALHSRISRRGEKLFVESLHEYNRHHALLGKTVTVAGENGAPPIIGRCEGLDHTGRLLVRDRVKLHPIIAGHVVARD